jgi:hypothetical protein
VSVAAQGVPGDYAAACFTRAARSIASLQFSQNQPGVDAMHEQMAREFGWRKMGP